MIYYIDIIKKGGYSYEYCKPYVPESIRRPVLAILSGTVQRTPTGNTATIAMPKGCVFVPEYEVYNLKNGMSYIKKV